MSDTERWITFDCFGTLADWNSGFRNILAPLAGDQLEGLVTEFHKSERLQQMRTPHQSYREVLAGALTDAAIASRINIPENSKYAIADDWQAVRPFDDIEPFLNSLRQSGYHLAVLTNCDEDLFEVTHRQFAERFDRVITAELVRDYKPSLTHFRRFQRVSGVASGDWIHIACSWYHDIVPAARFGIPSIWLDRDLTGDDPDLATIRVTKVSDLLPAIDHINHVLNRNE